MLVILSLFALLFSLNTILTTYGKYSTSIDEKAEVKIASWRILVNDEDVRNNDTETHTITPIFLGNNNINKNVIAPNAEGYFDLVIDSTHVDVSFKYEVLIF